MLKLAVLYVHLLGTCLALGLVMATDARLLARVLGWGAVLAPPSRFVRRAIGFALGVLLLSGAMLVALGLAGDPHYLANPKLQGKLLLVTLLCANASVLHHRIFPLLRRARPVAQWRTGQRNLVAVSVGLSASLWLYCAFLGIARPWSHTVPLSTVLAIGLTLWAVCAAATRIALALAACEAPQSHRHEGRLEHVKRVLRAGMRRIDRETRGSRAPELPSTQTAVPTALRPQRAAT